MQEFFRTDKWIPWSFVAGFGVILLANGIMVFNAFDSWTGVSTDDAYRQGLAYDRQLAIRRKAAAAGWSISARIDGAGKNRLVTVQVADRSGAPIRYASVTAGFERPIERGYDRRIELKARAPGRYVGHLSLPRFGLWRVNIRVAARGRSITATRRYDLRP